MSSPAAKAPPAPAQGSQEGATTPGTPRQLTQLPTESDSAYEALLLWAMQTPDARSNRLIARSMGTAESNVRLWRKKYDWEMRCARVPSAEYAALHIFRQRMEEHVGTDRTEMMRAALDIVLAKAGYARLRSEVRKQRVGIEQSHPAAKDDTVYKSELSTTELYQIDPARYLRDLSTRIRSKHLKETDVSKQIMLIDAVLGLIARRVQSGELQVRVSDIPSLLKARALLTGLPTEQVAVHQQVEHNHSVVVETLRMKRAKASGNEQDVLTAMREDIAELSVILDAVPTAQVIDIQEE